MRQFQIRYTDKEDFRKELTWIRTACPETREGTIIFYMTWTESGRARVDDAAGLIEQLFPEAGYYGNEASGNIAMGEFTFGIHVTCYAFEEKDTRTELVWVEQGTAVSSLGELWEYCKKQKELRAVELIPSMSYIDTLRMDGNIPDVPEDILLFGGASVNYDNATFDAEIVAKGHPRTTEGMAVMLYFGKTLAFSASDVLGWKGLGRLMEVTDSSGKTIRQIDGIPAYSIYENYLNLSMGDKDTLVFPLIAEEDGNRFIRTPQIIMPDKSMQMFAYIPKGTKVRISYGDKNTILAGISEKAQEIAEFRPEAIKAYSCAARRLFWGDSEVGRETAPLQQIAPVCGFYTGGEILRFGKKLRVLNQTLALVCIREGEGRNTQPPIPVRQTEDKSLVSRLTYFAEKIVEEEKAQRLLAEGLEKALSSDFQVMYYIDLAEGRATFLHGDADAMRFTSIFQTDSAEHMFENFYRYYVDAAVVEEDRERVKSVMNTENIFSTLKYSNSISVNYRVRRNLVDPVYTEMRILKAGEEDGRLTAVVLSFRTTDEEMRRVLELNEKLRAEILNDMIGEDGVYLIDCSKDSRKTIHSQFRGDTDYHDDEKYSGSFRRYVNTDVVEADRKMMLRFADPGALPELFRNEKEIKVEFRDTAAGVQRFCEMRLVRFSDTEILQSFTEKDKEIVDRMIFEKLEEEYFALFAADLDSGLIRSFKEDPERLAGEQGGVAQYTPTMRKLAASFEGETRDFFESLSNPENVKKRFLKEDKTTYIYKPHHGDGTRWGLVTGLVLLRHDDGTPSVFALGFSFLDEDAAKAQDFQTKLREDSRIIGALAKEFSCVDYVELTGDHMEDIAVEVRTSTLLRKLVPGWDDEAHFTKKLDLIREYLVFQPDREQFQAETRREQITEQLKARTSYFVNTRFMIGGEVRYYQIQFSAVLDKGRLLGVVFGLRSIDEQMRKELETQKQLEDALKSAEVANRSKSSFLFNMSHDIRTPMNAIKGYTAMAKKYADDGKKARNYLDKIDISSQQLITLINQVLEMSRIESGKIEFDEKPVDIEDRFNSMVTVIEAQAKAKGLDLCSSLENIRHYKVLADDSRMGQITLNVVGNAIKYTPEGGKVDFRLREIPARKEGYASYVFTVEDTGIGMSSEFLDKLFEPFAREKTSTVSKIQGTGLGMSIVKNLVDLKGGDIKVESAPGRGTRFDITLDFLLDTEGREDEVPNKELHSISFEGKRVLLVEDNEMNREIAKDILEEYGFLVEEADDGDVAVEMCRKTAERGEHDYYDFILMDIQMPRMNGYNATRAIRRIPSPENIHTPIIAMTANAFEEDRQNALNAGMDEHLAKPIDIQKLLDTLARFL